MKTKYLNMNKIRIAVISGMLFFTSLSTFAEAPSRGFNYQAIARDASGNPMAGKNILIELSIHQNTDMGPVVWQETHQVSTNEFGLFALVIGDGSSTGVGSAPSMKDVEWAAGNYFIQVQAAFDNNGFSDMGTSKLQAVPYAIKADSALAAPRYPLSQLPDVDLQNLAPGMVLQWNGTKWTATQQQVTDVYSLTEKIKSDSTSLKGMLDAETATRILEDNALNAKVASHHTTLGTHTTDISALKSDAQALNTNFTSIQVQSGINAADIALNTADISTLKTDVQSFNGVTADVQTLQTEVQSLNTAVSDVQTQTSSNVADIAIHATDINNLKTNILSLSNVAGDVQALNAAVTDVQFKAINNYFAIEAVNEEVATHTSDIASLNSSVAGVQTQTAANTGNIADLTGDVAAHTSQINTIDGKIQFLTSTIGGVQTQVSQSALTIAAHTAELTSIKTLADGKIYVGDAQNKLSEVSMSGDATMSNTGVVTIGSGAVTTSKLAYGSIITEKLDEGAVTTSKILDNAITTSKLGDREVTGEKIKDNAITNDKISDVSTSKLTGTITGSQIANGSVTESKLGDASVTVAKISASGTADGTSFLRGDGTWAAAGGTPAMIAGLTSIANSSNTPSGFNMVYSLESSWPSINIYAYSNIYKSPFVVFKNTGDNDATLFLDDNNSITVTVPAGESAMFLRSSESEVKRIF